MGQHKKASPVSPAPTKLLAAHHSVPEASPALLGSTALSHAPSESTIENAAEQLKNAVDHSTLAVKDAVKEIINTSVTEAKKAHEHVKALSRQGTENLQKSTEKTVQHVHSFSDLFASQMQALLECSNISLQMTEEINQQLTESANQLFQENMALAKGFFACSTLSDMLDLQSRLIETTTSASVNNMVKISDSVLAFTNRSTEPINAHIRETVETFADALKGE